MASSASKDIWKCRWSLGLVRMESNGLPPTYAGKWVFRCGYPKDQTELRKVVNYQVYGFILSLYLVIFVLCFPSSALCVGIIMLIVDRLSFASQVCHCEKNEVTKLNL